MDDDRVFVGSAVLLGLVAVAHAALTWPVGATVAFFGGGGLVAVLAELVAVDRGWLRHHLGPQVRGVPLYVAFGWTGVIYVAFRVALLTVDGWAAVALAAGLATAYDLLVDHRGVARGHWSYPDALPGPRRRGVPWYNYLGWLLVSAVTASLATPFL